jgi:TonB family protein
MRHSLLPLLFGCCLAAAGSAHADDQRPLDEKDIQEVARAHADEIRSCYQRHAAHQKEATGRVLLSAVVEGSGRVSDVSVEATGVRGTQFPRCVSARVKKWRFRETRSSTEIQYPFHFLHTEARGAGPSASRRPRRTAAR